MDNKLTKEQKELLKNIVNDKFGIGAFSGMIYNQVKECDSWDNQVIDVHVKLALRIRQRIIELTESEVKE